MSAQVEAGPVVRRPLLVAAAVAVVVAAATLAYVFLRPSDGLSPELTAVHDATSKFQTVDAVTKAGYAELLDADGIACIDHEDMGAMGIHYVHGDLVGDSKVDPERPEAMIYEPQDSGSLKLVGVEYVVFQDAWDAENASPPALFGHEFAAVGADNRYGIPAFYQLHAWVWRDNPAGTFADYNPDVTCDHAGGHMAEHMGAHEPQETPAATHIPPTPRPHLGGV